MLATPRGVRLTSGHVPSYPLAAKGFHGELGGIASPPSPAEEPTCGRPGGVHLPGDVALRRVRLHPGGGPGEAPPAPRTDDDGSGHAVQPRVS
jgi:hypothetical protein